MSQVQRMSRLMVKTLRDDPADAETISHKLLVRAGYVRRNAAGVWTWLPLGKKVLDNVSAVVREEMDAIGA
ncbi:proline--tRNA ligase, partial [Streptomyces sp. NPDC000405]